jgi:hypothetical protein
MGEYRTIAELLGGVSALSPVFHFPSAGLDLPPGTESNRHRFIFRGIVLLFCISCNIESTYCSSPFTMGEYRTIAELLVYCP